MANYVIVGAGAAGLYTAYRLLTTSGALVEGDTVQVYEWSQRPGGRIYTFDFPDTGVYAEVGGMRFATDHVLVQNIIAELNLTSLVTPFEESTPSPPGTAPESKGRMYYLRGTNVYESDLNMETLLSLPYQFNADFKSFLADNQVQPPYTADTILAAIASKFGPDNPNPDRDQWCQFFANGTPGSEAWGFQPGTAMKDIGYWNLLYDQLGDEGFDYVADGNGYTSNVINWNAADALQANGDYGSGTQYQRLQGGYSVLFDKLASTITSFSQASVTYGMQLTSLIEVDDGTTCCVFNGQEEVIADYLFLAMPRRALEMVAKGCLPTHMLNNSQVKYYLESSINQPSMKAVMVFDEPWYTSSETCANLPYLVPPSNAPSGVAQTQYVGGPTITDLPLRMVYYFGNNNVQGGPSASGGPYVVLASYDDMNYTSFWRELETDQDYSSTEPPSAINQPLTGPSSLDPESPFSQLLLKQLAEVHGVSSLPTPTAVYYQDWGQDPFGGGYHGWSPHYNICQAMYNIRAPYQNILQGSSNQKVYIIGSCYSFDQAWVEGAFCTAESVLHDYLNLPLSKNIPSSYALVCSPADCNLTAK